MIFLSDATIEAMKSGLSLSRMVEITGVSHQTLTNWYKYKNKLFQIVVAGCTLRIKKNQGAENEVVNLSSGSDDLLVVRDKSDKRTSRSG